VPRGASGPAEDEGVRFVFALPLCLGPNARGEPRQQPERRRSGGCWRRLQCVVRGRMGTTLRSRGGPPSACLACACAPARGRGAAPHPGRRHTPRCGLVCARHHAPGGLDHFLTTVRATRDTPGAWLVERPGGRHSLRTGPVGLLGTAPCLRHSRAPRWPSRPGVRPDSDTPPTAWVEDPDAPNAAGTRWHRHRAPTLRRRHAEGAADGLTCPPPGPRRLCRVALPHASRTPARPGRGACTRWRSPTRRAPCWPWRRATRTGSPLPSEASGPVRHQVPSACTGCQTVRPPATARVPPHRTPGSLPPHGAPNRPPGVFPGRSP
jgi:hypothetical protein